MYYTINLVSFVDYDSNCVYSAWSLTDDIISPNNVSVLFFHYWLMYYYIIS